MDLACDSYRWAWSACLACGPWLDLVGGPAWAAGEPTYAGGPVRLSWFVDLPGWCSNPIYGRWTGRWVWSVSFACGRGRWAGGVGPVGLFYGSGLCGRWAWVVGLAGGPGRWTSFMDLDMPGR